LTAEQRQARTHPANRPPHRGYRSADRPPPPASLVSPPADRPLARRNDAQAAAQFTFAGARVATSPGETRWRPRTARGAQLSPDCDTRWSARAEPEPNRIHPEAPRPIGRAWSQITVHGARLSEMHMQLIDAE
jgi:hypothetical protein